MSISLPSGSLFPKGECLSTHRVGPFGLNGFLFLGLLVLDFYPPTNRDLYLVVVVVVGVFLVPFEIFLGENVVFFFSFFLNLLSY